MRGGSNPFFMNLTPTQIAWANEHIYNRQSLWTTWSMTIETVDGEQQLDYDKIDEIVLENSDNGFYHDMKLIGGEEKLEAYIKSHCL